MYNTNKKWNTCTYSFVKTISKLTEFYSFLVSSEFKALACSQSTPDIRTKVHVLAILRYFGFIFVTFPQNLHGTYMAYVLANTWEFFLKICQNHFSDVFILILAVIYNSKLSKTLH